MKKIVSSSALLVLLAFSPLVAPAPALAFFDDTADATGSAYAAGTLSFSVIPDTLASGISSSFSPMLGFSLHDTGSIASQYEVSAEAVSCAAAFYDNLNVTVSGPVSYSGPFASIDLSGDFEGVWSMTFSTGSNLSAAPGESCIVRLAIAGWQNGFLTSGSGGFTHHEDVEITLTASEAIGKQQTTNIVLNEIYPNPDGGSAPLDREWIELYNGTGTPVDVEGWSVSEIAGSEQKHVISASNTCADGSKVGYARPYNGASTTIAPGGFLIVEFCASSRLNNGGDTVRLYDVGDSLIDAYTYSGSKAAGNSYQRVPDGYAWVDPKPTPGEPNTATEEDLRASGLNENRVAEILTLLEERDGGDGASTGTENTGPEEEDVPESEASTQEEQALPPKEEHAEEPKTEAPEDDTPPSDAEETVQKEEQGKTSSEGNSSEEDVVPSTEEASTLKTEPEPVDNSPVAETATGGTDE